VNVWKLDIWVMQTSDWGRAEKIMRELGSRIPSLRHSQPAAKWICELDATDLTLDQAIAYVERQLTTIDGEALEFIQVSSSD
jgi:hypothetical protein